MSARSAYRRLVPEVVQTSAMDCGPAALAALLGGCGRPVSYPRLRELCQTDVDGTSVDTLEELACQLGLDAEQVMLPLDSILDHEHGAMPCIAVVSLPSGLTHFIVIWACRFGWVQVMDPGTGRRWMSRRQLLEWLYEHSMTVPAEAWREHAHSEEFLGGLRARLCAYLPEPRAQALIASALDEGSWQAMAGVDALARLAASLQDDGSGKRALSEMFRAYEENPATLRSLIPEHHYQVTSTRDPEALTLRGAVLLKVSGVRAEPPPQQGTVHANDDLARVRDSRPVNVIGELSRLLRTAGMRNAAGTLALAGVLVGMLTFLEGLLLRFLLDFNLARDPVLTGLLALGLLVPLAAAALLERGALGTAYSIGRRLDTLLRVNLLRRLPRMRESYFESRLICDLAERGHAISQLKELPGLLLSSVILLTRLAAIGAGLVLLAPQSTAHVAVMMAVTLVGPLLLYPTVAEGDLRARAHLAAVGRINLDALRGAETLWFHGGGPAVELTQEGLLGDWRRSAVSVFSTIAIGEVVVVAALTWLAASLISAQLSVPSLTVGSLLLLAYWALSLPLVATELFETLRVAPQFRNIMGRVLELFGTEELEERAQHAAPVDGPVSLTFEDVSIERGDAAVLRHLELHIPAGQRVAIVGPSGAGKSTLIDTLLGFQAISQGALRVNGEQVTTPELARLRERTVTVNADLYLWNRSILDNLLYGQPLGNLELEQAITSSALRGDLSRLREGLATQVGENAARLSGGEGQRVRIARGLLRDGPSLVLLDEPFRGMDSSRRQQLLRALLQRWPSVTTLFISHDVSEALAFDRVIVIDDHTVVEDGHPATLRDAPDSHFSRLLAQERRIHERLDSWRHLWLRDGAIETRDER